MIAYSVDTANGGSVNVVHCGNATCSSGTTLTPRRQRGLRLVESIAIGTDGDPTIAYTQTGDTTNSLKLAHCGNTACSSGNTNTVVDTTGNRWTSLAIDAAGAPIVAYRDATSANLWFVRPLPS